MVLGDVWPFAAHAAVAAMMSGSVVVIVRASGADASGGSDGAGCGALSDGEVHLFVVLALAPTVSALLPLPSSFCAVRQQPGWGT